jgi:hypothetical protein
MAQRAISLATARAQYVHRYTLEHVPAWAYRPCEGNGRYYAPGYRTDAEWYEKTTFPGENGLPRREDHCQSADATWPLGKWLKSPCPAYAYLAANSDAKLAEMRAALEWCGKPAAGVARAVCLPAGKAFTAGTVTLALDGPKGGTRANEALTIPEARKFADALAAAIIAAEGAEE